MKLKLGLTKKQANVRQNTVPTRQSRFSNQWKTKFKIILLLNKLKCPPKHTGANTHIHTYSKVSVISTAISSQNYCP